MGNRDLLAELTESLASALPRGMTIDVESTGYYIRYGSFSTGHSYPEELPIDLLTILFLDSIQAAVADMLSDYWPKIGELKLDYNVTISEESPIIFFTLRAT